MITLASCLPVLRHYLNLLPSCLQIECFMTPSSVCHSASGRMSPRGRSYVLLKQNIDLENRHNHQPIKLPSHCPERSDRFLGAKTKEGREGDRSIPFISCFTCWLMQTKRRLLRRQQFYALTRFISLGISSDPVDSFEIYLWQRDMIGTQLPLGAEMMPVNCFENVPLLRST